MIDHIPVRSHTSLGNLIFNTVLYDTADVQIYREEREKFHSTVFVAARPATGMIYEDPASTKVSKTARTLFFRSSLDCRVLYLLLVLEMLHSTAILFKFVESKGV